MKEMLVCWQVWNRNHRKLARNGSKKRKKRKREEDGWKSEYILYFHDFLVFLPWRQMWDFKTDLFHSAILDIHVCTHTKAMLRALSSIKPYPFTPLLKPSASASDLVEIAYRRYLTPSVDAKLSAAHGIIDELVLDRVYSRNFNAAPL